MDRFRTFYYRGIKPLFIQKPLRSDDSEVPFFIISAGRSGSTLLRKLLLMHAPLNIPPESDDFLPKLIKNYLRYNHKSWQYIVIRCAELYNSEEAIGYWQAKLTEPDLTELLTCDDKDQNLAQIVRFFYSHYAKLHGYNDKHWGDKTPFLTFRLPWINLLYPSAKYIFLIRDGRAVVNSFLKMGKGYSLDTASERWTKALKAIRIQQKKIKPHQYLYVKYEELVLNPEKELQKIYTFLGVFPRPEPLPDLFLGDDMLHHHRNIKSEITSTFIQKWKEELAPSEIAILSKRLSSDLKLFGYR